MKSKKDFATIAEYRQYRMSPEFGEYMNSPSVTEAQVKIFKELRTYKDKRAEVHERHKRG